ncbi:MAG: 50S ribosomal protein L33 [Planctomycetota bacterium]
MVREWLFLECNECGTRYYRTSKKQGKEAKKLSLSKFCPKCKKHTTHNEKKK